MADQENLERKYRHTVGTLGRDKLPHALGVVDSTFWRDQAGRFESLREQALRHSKRCLGAGYHPDGWGLDDVRAFHGRSSGRWLLENGSEATAEEFKSVAGLCPVATGAPNTDVAWVDWLDYLRRDSLDFEPDEFVVESWAVEQRPEPNAEVSAPGLISPPVEIRPDANVQLVSHELGSINDVCTSSARVCRRMSDETLRLEIEALASKRGVAPAPTALSGISNSPVENSWDVDLIPGKLVPPPTSPTVARCESVAAARRAKVEPLLAARGWSTLDWANEAGVDYNTANNYLNGSTAPRRHTLKRLAEALGLTPADLLIRIELNRRHSPANSNKFRQTQDDVAGVWIHA